MRGTAVRAVRLLVLLVSLRSNAQDAPSATRPPLLPSLPRLVLTLPEPTSASHADDASKRWLLERLTLTPPPLLAATLTATDPLETAAGELSTYVAFAPLAAISGVTLTAQGAVAPKLQLDCNSTCQQQVEGSLGLDAQVLVAGQQGQANAAL